MLRHLKIQNYRGIKELNWTVSTGFICLLGPGDSCKSTILDAIELLLHPRYNPGLDDTDFLNCDPNLEIIIDGTFTHLPEEILREQRLGLCLRGVSHDGAIHDEPEDGDDEAVTVRVRVGSSLEPQWTVISDRNPDGTPFTTSERQKFGCSRLGATVDWQLSWTRNSILTRTTGNLGEHSSVLADASRQARKSASTDSLTEINAAAGKVATLAAAFGVAPSVGFKPGLDAKEAVLGLGAIALHDGEVPARRAGLGTRRLIAMALQRSLAGAGGGVMLVDEVEQALEPHRVRRLVRALKVDPSGAIGKTMEGKRSSGFQWSTVLTTHSPTVITELNNSDLVVVRREDGIVTPRPVPDTLRALVRKSPEAFLARRVIVCEGRTEVGLCRGIDVVESEGTGCFAYFGTAFADAGGRTEVGGTALAFVELGYKVSVFADSDADLDKSDHELKTHGVEVLRWDGKVSTEQRLALDLPWAQLVQMLQISIEREGIESVTRQIQNHLGQAPGKTEAEWRLLDESRFREAVGAAASGKKKDKDDEKRPGWFKRIDLAEELGILVANNLSSLTATDLGVKVHQLLAWVHSDV